MAWSIADVARMSGVTSRTLRHYDEIGLLPPAWIGSNGHRYYEEADLLRLQQILLMRELDVGLREIRAVLESQVDQVAVLRQHHQRLLAERDRLEMLARTVGRTIAELEEGKDNNDMVKINRPENLFEGFERRPPDRYRGPGAVASGVGAVPAGRRGDDRRGHGAVPARGDRAPDPHGAPAGGCRPRRQRQAPANPLPALSAFDPSDRP